MHQFMSRGTHLWGASIPTIFWVIGSFWGAAGTAWAADSASEPSVDKIESIRACARANLPVSSFSQTVELTSWDAGGGQRSLQGQLYGKTNGSDRISLMLSVEEPQDLSGARYLLNRRADRDSMYVYLPAMGRTRRVMGGMKGQPLWGTDFSYEDIKHLQSSLSEPDTEFLGTNQVDERTVHKLRVIPMAENESAYAAIEVDIDEKTCLLVQARFFDSSGVVKRMDSDPKMFTQLENRWVPGVVEIENLRSQTRSSLKLANYVFDQKLSNNHFNPKAFHLAH